MFKKPDTRITSEKRHFGSVLRTKRRLSHPFYGLKQFDIERVPGEFALEPDEGVTRGHGLDEGRVQGKDGRVCRHLLELGVLRLADARQVQVALCQGARLRERD